MVVDSRHAWTNRSCDDDQALSDAEADPAPWASLSVQAVTPNGIRPVLLASPVCVEGLCGNDQVAFPVTDDEGEVGVLVRADPAIPALEPLARRERPEGAPPDALSQCEGLPPV